MFPWNWVYGAIADSQALDPIQDARELDELARQEIISCIMDEAATFCPFRGKVSRLFEVFRSPRDGEETDVLNGVVGQVKALWHLHTQCCIYDWEDRCSIGTIVEELGVIAAL